MNDMNGRGLNEDWFGRPLQPPAIFSVQSREDDLIFSAGRQAPGQAAPGSREGCFTPELWRYDCAEIFFAEPSGRYLELNLAPNGAWWACWFRAPRQPEEGQPDFRGITASGRAGDQHWEASLVIPKTLFQAPTSLRYNVTFILHSPHQSFHSLAPLAGAHPDFHQPESFLPFPEGVHS